MTTGMILQGSGRMMPEGGVSEALGIGMVSLGAAAVAVGVFASCVGLKIGERAEGILNPRQPGTAPIPRSVTP